MPGRIVLTRQQAEFMGIPILGEGNNIPVEENASTINLIDADGEKLVLFEGFCNRCGTGTVMVYSSKTRRYLCTGCGRRTPSQTLAGKIWDSVMGLIK